MPNGTQLGAHPKYLRNWKKHEIVPHLATKKPNGLRPNRAKLRPIRSKTVPRQNLVVSLAVKDTGGLGECQATVDQGYNVAVT
jgi:hypothetical protein